MKTKAENRRTWAAASAAWKERQESARAARYAILVVHPMVTHWPSRQDGLGRGWGVLAYGAEMLGSYL